MKSSENKVYTKGNKNLFTSYVHQRIAKNKNFLVAITGPTGSGKTYSALRLAQQWDETFSADKIVFSMEDFILLLNSGTLSSGSVIVFEEAGVAMNNRKWQSFENNMIQFILQTFRHRNYIVIFTAPDFTFIDSASRKLMHCHMFTDGINHKLKFCKIRPYLLQINQRSGKIYYKYLTAQIQGTNEKRIGRLSVALPSKELLKEYEAKKTIFTTDLVNGIEEKMLAKMMERQNKNNAQEIKISKIADITSRRDLGETWEKIGEHYSMTGEGVRMWYGRNNSNKHKA